MSEQTNDTVFIGFQASPELRDKLDQLAKVTRRSRSETLRILVERATPQDLVVVAEAQ